MTNKTFINNLTSKRFVTKEDGIKAAKKSKLINKYQWEVVGIIGEYNIMYYYIIND